MFDFQHSQINQQEFEQSADLFLKYLIVYTTSKYIQHYTFHLNPTQFSKKERASKVPIHLQDKIELLLRNYLTIKQRKTNLSKYI